ncbi:SDR family NAD(P)-dependent oxidoreductase [Cupriavidus sp. UYPR2.512]|uniref:SDR family NAD(P)-dependent oxidoreductase n=1 Tax=Cupriavidus sp. UYPR2.512 TaxID=1080187 RepID=UPI000370CC8A|nr:SDR family NAD(P)-dependent oxidoreductase [Cupriavidus sp. UYPR2.512]UIF84730.1 SDR family oxidoreductase [Cupriavidus necator]
MSNEGKVALVTGGSQGIGEATARRLAREGYRVAVVASSSVAKAEAVAGAIKEAGGKAQGFVCDVRSGDAVRALVGDVQSAFGRVDVLVNCAGVFKPTPAGEGGDDGAVDAMIDINLKGTWQTIDAVVPLFKQAGQGRIVNIASVAAFLGVGNYAIYCATKAGIVMMTRALACELGWHNINVNCIAPGNTATPMNEDIRNDASMQAFRDAIAARTPSPRTFSEPDDIAGAVAFLASDAARSMNGSCLLMDEGLSAGM